MNTRKIWSWIIFWIGMIYFFLPIFATLEFSMRMIKGRYTFEAFRVAFEEDAVFTRESGLVPAFREIPQSDGLVRAARGQHG